MKRSIIAVFIICLLLPPTVFSCQKRNSGLSGGKAIKVVTTLFPVYDFAKHVGGKQVRVELLLPPGLESHSFEPKPGDIRKINDADVFMYTGKFMEPWIEDVLKGVANNKLLVVDTSTGIVLAEDRDFAEHTEHDQTAGNQPEHHYLYRGKDPHVWLDFSNAQTMVENIMNGFIAKDPVNRNEYVKNAKAYSAQLSVLDRQFQDSLSSCRKDMIIHGGHFAFGYLARRYHLRYLSAYRGFSPNAEPTPGDIMQLIKNLRNYHLNYIFFEELVSPNVSETIARETGAKLLMLHGAHNISRNEWEQNVTFLSLMENNLNTLRIGLECL